MRSCLSKIPLTLFSSPLLTTITIALCGLVPFQLDAAPRVFDEAGGVVVVEAEHFSDRQDGDPHKWLMIPTEDPGPSPFANARGGVYIQTLPNSGANNNTAPAQFNKPWVDYLVSINTAGTYRLWTRWNGYVTDNSLYAEIVELKDGIGGTIPDWYRYGLTDTTPGFDDFNRAWDGDGGFESNTGDEGGVPVVWDLTPGTYTVRFHMREDAAAIDAFALQLNSLARPGNPGPAESAETASFVRITQQPVAASATTGATATFTVVAEGTGTLTYQWQSRAPGASAFTSINGATSASFTTAPATDAMNGTLYQVRVSNGTKTAVSSAVALSTDSTPPSLVRASGGAGQTSVALLFSEKLDKASAETASNYTIPNLSVTGARLNAAGTTVILTTAKQTAGTSYTVTATGVKDAAGNAMTVAGTGTFSGATIVPGKLLVRLYRGIGGTAVNSLLIDPKYPNSPDEVFLWDIFSSGDSTGDVFGDNYGGEITGFYTPPTTGNYKFYIRSDDASQLLLSTDDTEGGLRQIAAQGGCCNAFTDTPGSLSSQPIALTAGQPYFVKAYWKEGGGGDFIQVGVLGPDDADINDASNVVPIPGQFLSTGFSKTATLSITQQPTNITVGANSPATFTVGYNANSVFGTGAKVQWQRAPSGSSAFTDIPNATSPTYTLQFPSAADNGAQFRAVLTIDITDPDLGTSTTATSQPATLTVSGDTTPPTVTFVGGGVGSIVVGFSEPVDATSATAAANYQVSGGVTVNSAQVISAAGEAGLVRVALTGVVPTQNYTVTISGVKDASGNTVASTTLPFEAFHIINTFDNGLVPPGAVVVGNANVKPSGSYNGSGYLELTANANSQQGSIIYDNVLPGADVQRFTASFKLFIGRGSANAADGFSFNVGSDIAPDITAPASFGEEGFGTGLIVAFDTYDNGGAEAPAIALKWQGTEFTTTNVTKPTLVNNQWVDVVIQVDANGRLTLYHNNVKYYDNEQIPGWAPITGAQVGLGGRTGGENEANWVDDFKFLANADVAVPKPPTISITSPQDNATFAAGANVTIQVNAQDPEGQIAKVEFFANGTKVGESTTAPYSLPLSNIPESIYLVTAKVTDAQGLSVTSPQIRVTVGNPGDALFLHAVGALNATDAQVVDRLIALGVEPIVMEAPSSTTEDANGKVLIVVSSTVTSADVGDKFRNVAVPVLSWENALQDNFLFTTDDAAAHGTTTGQTQLEITDPTHPIASGLSGVVTIADAPVELSWGMPAPAAKRVATLTDGTGHVGLYTYNTGDLLIDGTSHAAARRVHFPGTDISFSSLNANGLKLFDNAINWALGKTGGGPTQAVSISFTGITVNSNSLVTLTWTGGTPPYLVQAKASLSDATWLDVVTTSNQTATVPTLGNMAFYRVSDRAAAPVVLLTAVLSGANERPAVTTTGTGTGIFSLSGTQLTYQVSYANLAGNASAAHIHGVTNTTGSAGVIIPFPAPSGTSGMFSGIATVTEAQRAALLAGLTYANIHTSVAGGGEIRGQVAPSQFTAVLNGANERPTPVAGSGTGSGTLTLIGNQLTYDVSYSGLSSAATAAHIHGPAGTDAPAPVLIGLGTPSGTSGTLSGTLTLSQDNLNHILNGQTYINIHTVNNGGGEIRGQIVP